MDTNAYNNPSDPAIENYHAALLEGCAGGGGARHGARGGGGAARHASGGQPGVGGGLAAANNEEAEEGDSHRVSMCCWRQTCDKDDVKGGALWGGVGDLAWVDDGVGGSSLSSSFVGPADAVDVLFGPLGGRGRLPTPRRGAGPFPRQPPSTRGCTAPADPVVDLVLRVACVGGSWGRGEGRWVARG